MRKVGTESTWWNAWPAPICLAMMADGHHQIQTEDAPVAPVLSALMWAKSRKAYCRAASFARIGGESDAKVLVQW